MLINRCDTGTYAIMRNKNCTKSTYYNLMDCKFHPLNIIFIHVYVFSVRTCLECHNRNVRARDPRNVRDMERIVVDEWERLPQRVCFDFVASMHSRCRAVIDANSGHARY